MSQLSGEVQPSGVSNHSLARKSYPKNFKPPLKKKKRKREIPQKASLLWKDSMIRALSLAWLKTEKNQNTTFSKISMLWNKFRNMMRKRKKTFLETIAAEAKKAMERTSPLGQMESFLATQSTRCFLLCSRTRIRALAVSLTHYHPVFMKRRSRAIRM